MEIEKQIPKKFITPYLCDRSHPSFIICKDISTYHIKVKSVGVIPIKITSCKVCSSCYNEIVKKGNEIEINFSSEKLIRQSQIIKKDENGFK